MRKLTSRFELRLSKELAEALDKEVEIQDRAAAAITREALTDYLRKHGHVIKMRVRRGRRGDNE